MCVFLPTLNQVKAGTLSLEEFTNRLSLTNSPCLAKNSKFLESVLMKGFTVKTKVKPASLKSNHVAQLLKYSSALCHVDLLT